LFWTPSLTILILAAAISLKLDQKVRFTLLSLRCVNVHAERVP
jgi:hypothetical protein